LAAIDLCAAMQKGYRGEDEKPMKRVATICHAGHWDAKMAADRIVLDAGDRQRRRIVLTGEKGTEFLLDFARPVALRDGDGLLLDDGTLVLVAGAPEPLIEISAHAPLDTVRLAWHLGNRHTDVQIVGDKLRIRRDHVLEDMLRGLGAHLTALDAPIDPEPSAPHDHEDSHGA
jgi:urease accessory protein